MNKAQRLIIIFGLIAIMSSIAMVPYDVRKGSNYNKKSDEFYEVYEQFTEFHFILYPPIEVENFAQIGKDWWYNDEYRFYRKNGIHEKYDRWDNEKKSWFEYYPAGTKVLNRDLRIQSMLIFGEIVLTIGLCFVFKEKNQK